MPVAFGSTNSSGQYAISYLGDTDYTFLATKVHYQSYETVVNPADQDQVDVNLYPSTATEANDPVPLNSGLLGNHPNPFNPETKIEFFLSGYDLADLAIYNVKGQKVRTLVNEELTPGLHSVIWNGKDENGNDLTSGVYLYKLSSGGTESTRKMILMK